MLFNTQKFVKTAHGSGFLVEGPYIDVAVKQLENKKYVLFAQVNIYETGLYLVGYFILKDI